MSRSDYSLLVEKIRIKLSSWTAHHLSYAGRLQLLRSVICSITNFWTSAYRLRNDCITESEKLYAAFLWSDPDLNAKKAKVAWKEVCLPKAEGELGFQSIKEANVISCLKLIWRIVSNQQSLWVKWIKMMLIGKDWFWTIKENTTKRSWMWRKILKYWELAKSFHRIEVCNGRDTSFWFDHWSQLERVYDLTGSRGPNDMGIPLSATFAEAMRHMRTHRVSSLNSIEEEIDKKKREMKPGADPSLWKYYDDVFNNRFVTKTTSNFIREKHATNTWYKGVWFTQATPKYSFILWLAIHNRLTTGDKMKYWHVGLNTLCSLCGHEEDTRNHLFFGCRVSGEIWRQVASTLLGSDYTTNWEEL